jgi:integration host factor subunit beta
MAPEKEVLMNKSELVKTLAENNYLSLDEAAVVVDTFFDSMRNTLCEGNRVEIRGLGSFKIKNYAGYSGRNPKTGAVVNVVPKKLPSFRVGKDLKDFLNGQP